MLGFLHGYLLDGSGSNLWTRNVAEALCREGETVHLVCQEGKPQDYPFIAEAHRYPRQGEPVAVFSRPSPYRGKAVFHRIELGHQLPVFVEDHYDDFFNPTPMVRLGEDEIEAYLEVNVRALVAIVARHGLTRLIVNHVVLLAAAVERVHEKIGIPYAVVPHGSDLEYAVRRDVRFQRLGARVLGRASRVFPVTSEITDRLTALFPEQKDLRAKVSALSVGVDTARFLILPPERKREGFEAFLRTVHGLPRGKDPAREAAPSRALSRPPKPETYRAWLEGSGAYDGKRPDHGFETRLAACDWGREPVALFVGRLIAAKGFQTLVAALPLLWKAVPGLRVVAVGHGPLREVAELFAAALKAGNVPWIEAIAAWGSPREGDGASGYFLGVAGFLQSLKRAGTWDAYLEAATRMPLERLHWTGYLTHRELAPLYPLADLALIPSLVPEAGPMVLLEAAASGVFPLGTYQAGLAHNLDKLFSGLPPSAASLARLSPDPQKAIFDTIAQLPAALVAAPGAAASLRDRAVAHYDWASLARRLLADTRLTTLVSKPPERAGNF